MFPRTTARRWTAAAAAAALLLMVAGVAGATSAATDDSSTGIIHEEAGIQAIPALDLVAADWARRAGTVAVQRSDRLPSAWLGRYCTPLGCQPRRANTVASCAGFGVAILAAGWLSRRRTGSNH